MIATKEIRAVKYATILRYWLKNVRNHGA